MLKPISSSGVPRLEFGSEEALRLARDALAKWAEEYPEAAKALSRLWAAHLMNVGHKRLGRMVREMA